MVFYNTMQFLFESLIHREVFINMNKKHSYFSSFRYINRILKYLSIMIVLIFLILLIRIFSMSTHNNAKPEALYDKDNSIDLLVYNDTAYVNASNINWINELQLTSLKPLGTIKRSNVKKRFKNNDATKLPEGTEFYATNEREEIILVKSGDVYVPYYKVVEG